MTKYELPDQPNEGSWVKDADNDLWENTGSGWFCRTDETISYKWAELLYQYGPLESVDVPYAGEVRSSPFNQTVIAVFDGEKWVRWEWTSSTEKFKPSFTIDNDNISQFVKAT